MQNIECETLLYSSYCGKCKGIISVLNACEKEFYFNYDSLLRSDSIAYCNLCIERIWLILDLLRDLNFYSEDEAEPAYENSYLVFKDHIKNLGVKFHEC